MQRAEELEDVNLSSNDFGDEIAPFLVRLLSQQSCKVKRLNLANTCLTSEGARLLSEAIASDKRFRPLHCPPD